MHRKHPLLKTLPHMGKIVLQLLHTQQKDRNQLCKLTGWSRTSVDKLLLKKNWSNLEMLVVSQALHVKLSDYLYPEEEPQYPKSAYDAEVAARQRAEHTVEEQRHQLVLLQTEVDTLKYAMAQ
ncbi:MAG: hypothetical protein IPH78_09065, partial [Bacteroidetes bacterium]|nr:hypothetical protein [Bacteroidota bacterium]